MAITLLDLTEAAEALRVDKGEMLDLIDAGGPQTFRIDGRLYVYEQHLHAYLKDRTVPARRLTDEDRAQMRTEAEQDRSELASRA